MIRFFTIYSVLISAFGLSQAPTTRSMELSDPVLSLIDELPRADLATKAAIFQELYEHSHYSIHTELAIQAIDEVYKHTEHQELKAEAGMALIEFYRQLGQLEDIERVAKSLGFLPGWNMTGPLPGDTQLDMDTINSRRSISLEGANRGVQEYALAAYGLDNYFDAGAGHFGFFSANLALFPAQLTSAYFRAWFYSDGQTPIRLGLGWYNKMSVWVNHTSLAHLEADQIPHVDQKVFYFKIKKGWHQLTLRTQSDDQKSILGFFARLTDVDGNPIPTQYLEKKRGRKKTPTILESEPFEAPLLDIGRQQGPGAQAGVMLLKEIIRNGETPKDLLLKAFNQAPNRRTIEKLLLLEDRPNKRWEYLDLFLKEFPGDPWALAQKGSIAMSQSRFWEARNYARQVLETYPDYWKAHLLECNVLSQMNLYGESLKRTEQLRQRFGAIPWILMDLCDLYGELGMEDRMAAALKEIRAIRHNSRKYNGRTIQHLMDRQEIQPLQAFYEELVYEKPDNITLFLNYIEFLAANNQYEKALGLLESKVAIFPENPYLLEQLGRIQLAVGRDEGVRTLRRTLEIDPQNPQVERLIQLYHRDEASFYADKRATFQGTSMLPEKGIVIDVQNTVKKITDSGQASEYHQIEYLVVDEEGLKNLPGHAFSYSPLRQRAEILKAEIVREDQTIILDRFRRMRQSDPTYRMYYDMVSYQIHFPALKVGDRIVLEYRVDDMTENIFGNYFGGIEYFAGRFPVNEMRFSLILPKNLAFQHRVVNMNPIFESYEEGEDEVHVWRQSRVSIMESEPLMPPMENRMPYISYSSFDSWDAMAAWYHDLIEEQLILDDETRQIVHELTRGLTDRKAIVEKLHEYVITQTRYVALEFGIHGYKPYSVNQVCSRQFGDCKDKASLLIAMLREAGIEASIAIVRTADRGRIAEFPANLSSFNHAIAYVPEFDLYLDGTAEYSGMDELPKMDQGAMVLLVNSEGKGKLTTIPISSASANRKERTMELTLSEANEVQIKGNMRFQGVHAPSFRRYLEGQNDSSDLLKQVLSMRFPGLELSHSELRGQQLNQPVEVHFEGASDQILIGGNQFPLNSLGDPLLPSLAPTAERQFPVWLGVPETLSVDVVIRGAKMEVSEIPAPLEIDSDYLRIAISVVPKAPGELELTYKVVFKKPLIPVKDYNEFRSQLAEHDRFLESSLQLR